MIVDEFSGVMVSVRNGKESVYHWRSPIIHVQALVIKLFRPGLDNTRLFISLTAGFSVLLVAAVTLGHKLHQRRLHAKKEYTTINRGNENFDEEVKSLVTAWRIQKTSEGSDITLTSSSTRHFL